MAASDLPLSISELPGMADWEKYNGVDINGTHYTPAQVASDEGLRGAMLAKPIYTAAGGGYTTDFLKSNYQAEMSLNKDTGNIQIKAPQAFLDTDYYKETLKPQLLQLSQAYKLNPEYSYKLLSDNDAEKTTEDWVNELNKDFAKEVKSALIMDQTAKELSAQSGLEMGNKQVTKASTVAREYNTDTGEVVQVKDSDMQSLPLSIRQMAALRNLEGYDENEHVVSFGNLKNALNRDKVSDEDLIEMYEAVGKYFNEGNYTDADEYAEMTAFANFLDSFSPTEGFWKVVGDVVGNIGAGIGMGLANLGTGFEEVAGSIIDFISMTPEDSDTSWAAVTKKQRATLETAQSSHQYKASWLNPATSWIENVGYVGIPIAAQIYLGAISGQLAGALVGNAVAGATAASALEAASTVENVTTATMLATDLYRGTEVMLSLQSAAQANATIAGAITGLMSSASAGVAGSVAGLKGLSAGAKAFITMSDLAANTVVDVVMTNPKLFQQFMSSDGDEDAKAYVMEQINQNIIFWGGISVVGKAFKAAGKTKVGTIVNAATASKASYIKAKIGKASDAISTVLHKGDKDWLEKKVAKATAAAEADPTSVSKHNKMVQLERKQTVKGVNREILRKADEEIGAVRLLKGQEPVNSFEELYERAKAIRTYQSETLAAANDIADTIYLASTAQENARLAAKYTGFTSARNSYLDSLRTVVKAENKAGITTAQKVIDSGTGMVPAISKQTNNYINSVYRSQLLENWKTAIKNGDLTADADTVNRIDKELLHHKNVVKEFQKDYGDTDLVAAANELLRKAKSLSRQTESMRVSEKILSRETLQSWESDPRWKNGYLRQQREQEFMAKLKNTGDIKVGGGRELQHLKVGSTDDYADISFVLFDDINDVAKQTIRNRMVNDLDKLGIEMNYRVTGNELQLANTLNANQSKAIKTLQGTSDDFVKNIDDIFYQKFFNRQANRSRIFRTQEKAMDQGIEVAKAKSTVPKVTRAERKAFVNNLVDEDLNQIISLDQTSPFFSTISDDDTFNNFLSNMDKTTRKQLSDNMAAQAGYLYPEGKSKDILTMDNFKMYLTNNPEAWTDLKRSYIINNKELLNSPMIVDTLTEIKKAENVQDAISQYNGLVTKLNAMKSEMPGIETNLNGLIDGYINDAITSNKYDRSVMKTLDALSDGEDIAEYMTLRSMANKKNLEKLKDNFYTAAKDNFNKIATKQGVNPKDVDRLANNWADIASEWLEDRIIERYGRSANTLKEAGSSIVDQQDLYSRIRDLNKKISGAKQDPRVIKVFSGDGMEEYIELSPTVAHLITNRPNFYWTTPFGAISQRITRAFRMGTTGGLVPSSLVNQAFRDTGLATGAGGATKLPSRVERELADEFGETFAQYYAKNAPDVYESLMKKSKLEGRSFGDIAAEYERNLGKANVETELESQLYRSAKQNYYQRNADGIYDASIFETLGAKFDRAYEKTEKLNNMREMAERDFVYTNNFQTALQQGMGVQEARNFAQLIQANATTNFGRWTYHLDSLRNSVPYLGSAINGQKSFYRLMAFDPVGVTSRIVSGYVLPVIALTNMSLSDPESARIYSQIKEYEKDDNLIFVIGGQIFSIPIPQEMSIFVRPVQSAVETAYGANRHGYTELFTNEVASAFPLDFSGFVNIDRNPLTSDDMWTAHIAPGLARLSSEMLSPIAKSGVMLVTHVDPYTMKNIDTSYVTTDPETGEQLVMNGSAGNVAQWIGSLFGGVVSAPMAQAMLNTLLGKGNRTILDGIGGLAASVLDGNDATNLLTATTDFLKSESELAIKPITVERYGEYENQMWKQAVAQLYNEKEALMRDEGYQADLRVIASATSSEKAKNEARSRVNTKQTAYQEHVLEVANKLKTELGGTLDRNKFASVISLMVLGDSTNQNPNDNYSSWLNSQEYKSAKAAAVETMNRMGFSSVEDQSIFGYYKEQPDGTAKIVYNSPLAVLDYDLNSGMQSKVHLANVRSIVDSEGLWTQHDKVNEQIQKIYNKKKLSNSDYANIDAIQINWNAKVAESLADYVSKYSAEAVINNSDVRNYLYSLIEVPSSWEKNNQNRSVSLGDKGNKKKAYYDSWIKSMFSVNDPYKGQY